ncbi:acid protease, partial [Fistulina hepatica ATCC 64428]
LPLTIDRRSYYAVVQAGGLNFRVDLDTGSSDLWLLASSCTSTACKDLPTYPLKYYSDSFITVDDNATLFNITYADTTAVSGFVAREKIGFGNITVHNQTFGLVTSSNVSLVDDTSGILGIGFPRLSTISSSKTFLESLAEQGLLSYPLFGVSLTYNDTGSLSLGAVDSSVVTNISRISWNQVSEFAPSTGGGNSSSYLEWAIRMDGFSVNGTFMDAKPTYPNVTGNHSLAMFDVGTPGIYGPFTDVSRLFAKIDAARIVDTSGQWAVPCDTLETISLSFGGKNYTMQPSDYLIGPTKGDAAMCLSWPYATEPNSYGIDWQIGTAFMRTVYTVFSYGIDDKEPPTIGLYKLDDSTTITENATYLSSFFSSMSATQATTLPNYVLSTPSYSASSYALNSSVTAYLGGVVTSGLATSTYSALLGTGTVVWDTTAVPTIAPAATVTTLTTTDSQGETSTTTVTSYITQESLVLGVPGWGDNAATVIAPPVLLCYSAAFALLGALVVL